MCGITGLLDARSCLTGAALESEVATMAATLHRRGPDDSGLWCDPHSGVGLGHRRLAILDLSARGHQPMCSECGRYVVVFNGEIYNYRDLRTELEEAGGAPSWRSESDTETLLAAIAHWGLLRALERVSGMFAFALWDRHERMLHIARDRLGEKPLYYGWQGDIFLFGSELKALRACSGFRAEIDRQALTLFLRYNYVPAPYSIYRGIHKLLPGTYLTVSRDNRDALPMSYWSAREVAEKGQRYPFAGSEAEAVMELDSLLRRSIAGQMMADVPLGAFLSGGVDSSTVVALMQAQSPRPVKTFTIGFWEKGYNEAEHAKSVAQHLGTDHTEIYVTPQETLAVIPRLPELYDEPFADSSQVPTFLVSKLARQHVTVSLSGDGGDELFGGYNRYLWVANVWRALGWTPRSIRTAMAGTMNVVSPRAWDTMFQRLKWILPAAWQYAEAGDKLRKLAEVLDAENPEEIYRRLVSHWKRPSNLVKEGGEPVTVLTDRSRWPSVPDLEHRMMYLDQVSFLPDDILVKLDRAAMGVSLETRVPFLDHNVVEFAWKMPLSMKIRDGQGKWLLRKVLYKYIPRELIERPKMGFGVPLDTWLRGPLKEWAEALLDEARLRREGYFNPAPIREKWMEHLSGRRNWSSCLWSVLMFQAWYEATADVIRECPAHAAIH